MRQSLFLYTNNERGRIPAPSDNSVNLPFTYAIYFFFLCDQNTGTYPCTLTYSFFFEPPKKNESRKRRPPETPIPLRMSVIAKWAKLAALKQNAHF